MGAGAAVRSAVAQLFCQRADRVDRLRRRAGRAKAPQQQRPGQGDPHRQAEALPGQPRMPGVQGDVDVGEQPAAAGRSESEEKRVRSDSPVMRNND